MKIFVPFFIVLHVKSLSHSSLSQRILLFYFFISKLFQKRIVLRTLWNTTLNDSYNLECSPKQTGIGCLAFFFFSFCPQLSVTFIIWRVGGGKSKNKKPTCFIKTIRMKLNVFSHLNQLHLSFVLYNYSWSYKWKTRAKLWFHTKHGIKIETNLVNSIYSKVPLKRENTSIKV